MHLEEMRALRNSMETDIKIYVANKLEAFKEQTGFSPSAVNVDMLMGQYVGGQPRYVVRKVSILVLL